MKNSNKFTRRCLALVGFFAAVCLFYTIKLSGYQIFGDHSDIYRESASDTITYKMTIPAVRGDICDTNGKIIVTTKEAYSVSFNYWSMPSDIATANRTILAAVEAIKATNSEHLLTTDYFPFEGTYPSLTFSAEAYDTTSKVSSKLSKVLKYRKISKDGTIKSDTAQEMISWYLKKYKMVDSDKNPLYTNEEITALLRIRYNMDATDYGSAQDYMYADNVSADTVAQIKERGVRGIIFPQSISRQYNYEGYLSQVLGNLGKITAETYDYYVLELGYSVNSTVGVSGVEALFEEYLHGTDGIKTVVEDANGNVVKEYVDREPVEGKDIWLTIDIDIQVAAEDALRESVLEYGLNTVKAGAMTAIDPTGAVLAIASYPTYNLATFNEDYSTLATDPAQPLLNRATNGLYTPGSTFKPGIAAAALEEGIITQNSTVHCSGVYSYYSPFTLKCWVYPDAHGSINVFAAIARSCNCFFCDMGRLLGIEKMNKYCKIYGLGEKTGIEIGEKTGILAGEEYRDANGLGSWYPGDTVAAAIGQSDNQFTPIQISSYMATLMNGGTRYKVHLFNSVREFYTDKIYESYTPEILSQSLISSSTVNIVKKGMRQMITESYTATTAFRNIPVEVGAKTGTAQIGTTNDNGLFVVIAPYNKPEIIISCVIEGAGSGLKCVDIAAAALEAKFGTK